MEWNGIDGRMEDEAGKDKEGMEGHLKDGWKWIPGRGATWKELAIGYQSGMIGFYPVWRAETRQD